MLRKEDFSSAALATRIQKAHIVNVLVRLCLVVVRIRRMMFDVRLFGRAQNKDIEA
jgi:hypothetical protein